MATQARKNLATRARCEEGHHVAGADDRVEALFDALRAKVELGEVAYEPGRTRMIFFGSGDEHRITVDPHDRMPGFGQERTHPTGSTAGVEYSGGSRDQGIDEASLAGQIVTRCRHRPEALDVPVRVAGILQCQLGPTAVLDQLVLLVTGHSRDAPAVDGTATRKLGESTSGSIVDRAISLAEQGDARLDRVHT